MTRLPWPAFCRRALPIALCLCLAGAGAKAADPPDHFDAGARTTARGIVIGEDATAAYIIDKMLLNFKYRGYDKLGQWTMNNPVIGYRRPFFDISVVKLLQIPGEPDHIYTLVFRIDLSQVKLAQIERGVFHVMCISKCVEAASNGEGAAFDYFWINAITIHNPIDAERVNRAFKHLLTFYPVVPEPFDGAPARGRRR